MLSDVSVESWVPSLACKANVKPEFFRMAPNVVEYEEVAAYEADVELLAQLEVPNKLPVNEPDAFNAMEDVTNTEDIVALALFINLNVPSDVLVSVAPNVVEYEDVAA
jgi:hypothetical protein